jgi:hypothetical protein
MEHLSVNKGVDPKKIYNLGNIPPKEIFRKIYSLSGGKNVIFGVGNIVGLGMEIVDFFKRKKEQYG